MPAISPIVINDGKDTPVSHTFSPAGIDKNGVAHWADRSSSYPLGFGRLSLSIREPANGSTSSSGVYRVKAKLTVPKLDTLSVSDAGYTPAPTKAYEDFATVEFVVSARGSSQDREDLRVLLIEALSDSQFTSVIEDLEPSY
jgi:hypothetical protein